MSTTQYRTWIEVSKSAILHNVHSVLANVPKGKPYMGMVKGNAWGLGTVGFAKILVEAGADWIGTTMIEDALSIREALPRTPVMILMEFPYAFIPQALENGIILTVFTEAMAQQVSRSAQELGLIAKVHIKVNTGLNRVGVSLEDAVAFAEQVHALPNIALDGIYTHFSCADQPKHRELTKAQLASYLDVVETLKGKGISFRCLHAANSPATIDFPDSYLDMVRPGMSITGLYPSDAYADKLKIMFPMTWKTGASYVRRLRAGETVGYGGKYACARDTTIITIPVGAADGLGKRFEGRGTVLIHGREQPLISIAMDQAMVAIEGEEDYRVGDEVVILGGQQGAFLDPHDVSARTAYGLEELVCQISYRIPRLYVE